MQAVGGPLACHGTCPRGNLRKFAEFPVKQHVDQRCGCPQEGHCQGADELCAERGSQGKPGVEDIRIPSERAFRSRECALREGLEIDRVVFNALVALCAR